MTSAPTTSWETVEVEELDEGRLFRVRLSAGKGNVLDSRMIADLREVVAVVGRAPRACALVIDHAGKHFCFGASLQEHLPDKVGAMLPRLHALVRELMELDVPVLTCVRGVCLGGGLELAALADRIFAAPDARFGQPEVTLGVFAPVGSLVLPALVGRRDAADLLLTGRVVGAEEACAMGLVAEIADDPGDAALRWAREHLCTKSASALRFATHAARRAHAQRLLADLTELERIYLGELMRTHDAVEGVDAFLNKREPRWADR